MPDTEEEEEKLLQDPLMTREESGLPIVATRIMRQELKRNGVEERELPEILKNRIIKKGKKGPTGQIVVRRISGVENNAAARTARQFEENCGGLDDIGDKLEAVKPSLNKEQLDLLLALREPSSKKRLPRLLAETGAEMTGVMTAYTRGALLLGQTEAIREAARNLPRIMKDLALHALDGDRTCYVCVGTGKVAAKKGGVKESKECPLCRGAGKTLQASKHKEFAVSKILEVTRMVEKSPMVQVNQQTAVKIDNSSPAMGATMEKVAMMADEILHGRPMAPRVEVVEGEVISEKA